MNINVIWEEYDNVPVIIPSAAKGSEEKNVYNKFEFYNLNSSKMLFIKTLGDYSCVVMKHINAHLRNETKKAYKGLNDFNHLIWESEIKTTFNHVFLMVKSLNDDCSIVK